MDAFLVAAVRTPIGKFLGGLSALSATDLGAVVVREAVRRSGLPANAVEDCVLGCVVQAGLGQAPARQAALRGGLPDTVPALTINMVCGSGLKAAMLAAQAIHAGEAQVILAGGMESMSNAPFLLPNIRSGYKFGDQTAKDALLHDGLWCSFENAAMGAAAEHTARSGNITRARQDEYSALSHHRAAVASSSGAFTAEIVPVPVGGGAKATIVGVDEGIRPESTTAALAKLRPAFDPQGSVTAGNASQLSDGAAAVLVASAAACAKHGLVPLARIVASHTSGVAPKEIFTAPVGAVRGVLARAKLTIAEIDLFELNEAFASQMLACGDQLGLDLAKVNVNGGAIALGHPIGASGARVLVTLLHAMQVRDLRYGLASLCLGGGNAVAMIIERPQ